MRPSDLKCAALALMCCAAPEMATAAPVYTVIHSFTGGMDGSYPNGGLIRDEAGNLYGTTQYGGGTAVTCKYGCGTVFRLSPPTKGKSGWTEEILHRFAAQFATSHVEDGVGPVNNLAFGPSGGLYGNTWKATDGAGYVFELIPTANANLPWTENIIMTPNKINRHISFSDGLNVTFDPLGNLWFGGQAISPPSSGQTSWTPQQQHLQSVTGVAFDESGHVYGVNPSEGGGNPGHDGNVQQSSLDLSTYAVLHVYQATIYDSWPMIGASGEIYLNVPRGGYQHLGAIYRLLPPSSGSGNWTSELLYSFKASDSLSCPAAGLVQDAHGAIYGISHPRSDACLYPLDKSGVWKLTPPPAGKTEWKFSVLAKGLTLPAQTLVVTEAENLFGSEIGDQSVNMGASGSIFEISQ